MAPMSTHFVYFVLFLIVHIIGADDVTPYDYGMVIDAGSSRSRLHIYRWEKRVTSNNVPPHSVPEQIARSSSMGPISSIKSQSESDELILSLIEFTKEQLLNEESRWNTFPIYLKATAGKRILNPMQRRQIMGYIRTSFENTQINPFSFDQTYSIISSGEEEATFGWLGVNFVADNLLTNDDKNSFGVLDLGGQSVEIAFSPDSDSAILEEFTSERLWDITHRLYTRSFLKYGNDAVAQRVAQIAFDEAEDKTVVYNPCINNGANRTFIVDFGDGDFRENKQFGNAQDDLTKCKEWISSLISKDTTCYSNECSFNGVYQAEIPSDMTFIAFSAFGFAVSGLNISENIDLYDLYYNVALDVCGMNYDELRNSPYHTRFSSGFLNTYCHLTTYIFVLLHEGYGFPLVDTNIIFTNEVNGIDISSWTTGSMLRDVNWLPYELETDVPHTCIRCVEKDECKDTKVSCTAGQSCAVLCGGESTCSGNAVIDGSEATELTVRCSADDACSGNTVIKCGTGKCLLFCESAPTVCQGLTVEGSYTCKGSYCPRSRRRMQRLLGSESFMSTNTMLTIM